MTRAQRRRPDWLNPVLAALATGALASAAVALYLTRPSSEGASLPPTSDARAKDQAYKAFQDRLDGYRACRADADCVRVKADCACTAVAKGRLADFRADYARTSAEAGLSTCADWPEPSCSDATSSPVCAHGACRVHVTIEDASWDQ